MIDRFNQIGGVPPKRARVAKFGGQIIDLTGATTQADAAIHGMSGQFGKRFLAFGGVVAISPVKQSACSSPGSSDSQSWLF